jgi:hypothetical protein
MNGPWRLYGKRGDREGEGRALGVDQRFAGPATVVA